MATAKQLLDQARQADDLQALLKQGIGGTILAISLSIASGILTVADVVIKPLTALGNALGDVVEAIFGGPAVIVLAGVEATVKSLLGPFNVGPATFALSIASVLLGYWIVASYLGEDKTTNFGLFGTGIDIPTPGFGDAEEDSGDD